MAAAQESAAVETLLRVNSYINAIRNDPDFDALKALDNIVKIVASNPDGRLSMKSIIKKLRCNDKFVKWFEMVKPFFSRCPRTYENYLYDEDMQNKLIEIRDATDMFDGLAIDRLCARKCVDSIEYCIIFELGKQAFSIDIFKHLECEDDPVVFLVLDSGRWILGTSSVLFAPMILSLSEAQEIFSNLDCQYHFLFDNLEK